MVLTISFDLRSFLIMIQPVFNFSFVISWFCFSSGTKEFDLRSFLIMIQPVFNFSFVISWFCFSSGTKEFYCLIFFSYHKGMFFIKHKWSSQPRVLVGFWNVKVTDQPTPIQIQVQAWKSSIRLFLWFFRLSFFQADLFALKMTTNWAVPSTEESTILWHKKFNWHSHNWYVIVFI